MMSMYRDSDGKTVVDIKDCETMREVKILKMGNLGLTEFDTQLFSELENLEEMDISRNQVESIPDVVHLPRLRRLDCSHNRLTGLNFVRQFPQLEEINVEGNSLAFADFCIASFLCPKLKSINGQEVNILELNRMVETRMKPKINKVWSDHILPLYSPSMSDDEFKVLADKFRQLINACSKPTAKTISKFLDFRIGMLVDEYLVRVRKEEIIEFGGSEKTVKRNYAKKRKKDELADTEVALHTDATEAQHESAMVVAVADEQGNGIVTAEDAAALIASEQLKECSSVTIFVENVVPGPAIETSEPVVSLITSATNPTKDFVDEESERLKRMTAEREAARKAAISVQRKKSEVNNFRKSAAAAKSSKKSDDKQKKIVRYWVYDEESLKPKVAPTTIINSEASITRRSSVTAVRRGAVVKRKGTGDLMELMKKNGTLPDVHKVKIPDIDVHQAAQLVVQMKSSPMVVYRGRVRQKKGVRKTKLPATFKKAPTTKDCNIVSLTTTSDRASTPEGESNATEATTTSSPVEAQSSAVIPTDIPQPVLTETHVKVCPSFVPELTNGQLKAINDKTTDAIKPRSTLRFNDSCFPPKKRVRFIDAFKDPPVT